VCLIKLRRRALTCPQVLHKASLWNCRRLSCPSAIRSLRVLIWNLSPDVLFLFETKTASSSTSNILNRLGFYLLIQVPPSNSSGGLLLAWHDGVELECFVQNKNFISAWCYSNPLNNPWILSCVYGPPKMRDRSAFWDSLSNVGYVGGSWLCIRDFNHILDSSKKIWGGGGGGGLMLVL
jgi:hypothetical protein